MRFSTIISLMDSFSSWVGIGGERMKDEGG
jgi:hypothetical protein